MSENSDKKMEYVGMMIDEDYLRKAFPKEGGFVTRKGFRRILYNLCNSKQIDGDIPSRFTIVEPNFKQDIPKDCILEIFIHPNHKTRMIKFLLDLAKEYNISLNYRSKNGWTPLVTLINAGTSIGLLKRMIDAGAEINFCNESKYFKYSPLAASIVKGKFEITKFLLQQGADVNVDPFEGVNTRSNNFILSICSKNTDIINLMIDNGANVNKIHRCEHMADTTPLLKAANSKCFPVVKLLIEKGADPNLKIKEEMICIDFLFKHVCKEIPLEIVKLLVNEKTDFKRRNILYYNQTIRMIIFIKEGRYDVVDYFISVNPPKENPEAWGPILPFIILKCSDYHEIVEKLLSAGSDPSKPVKVVGERKLISGMGAAMKKYDMKTIEIFHYSGFDVIEMLDRIYAENRDLYELMHDDVVKTISKITNNIKG